MIQAPSRRLAYPMLAALLGMVVLLPFLGRPLVSREQELRVILTARDMARGGDWLIPHYLGNPRLNKPPLQYWFTAAAFKAAGTTASPAAARLPNVLLGATLLASMAALGRGLIGPRRALVAAAAAGTTFLFWRFGRLAETDMSLAAFETLTVLCLFRAVTTPLLRTPAWRWWVATGATAGVAFMVKGPAAIALPAATLAAFWFTTPKPARRPIGALPILVALGLALAIVIPWYAYALSGAASRAASHDVTFELQALSTRTRHAGSPLFYLYTLPLLMLPWGAVLPWALWRLRRSGRARPGQRWCLCWFLASLLVMSLTPSKQAHYTTLLLAPAAFILSAAFGQHLLHAARRAWPRRLVLALAAITLVVFWTLGGVLHELAEPTRIVAAMVRQTARQCTPDTTVYMAGRRLNSMQYYLDRTVLRVDSLAEALAQGHPGDLVILAADASNPVLPPRLPVQPELSLRQGDVSMLLLRIPPAVPQAP